MPRSQGQPVDRDTLREALRHGVFDGAGETDPDARAAAASGSGAGLDQPLADYTAMVRDASYRITDDDIVVLRAAGQSEEAIFELTVAAALGAALRRHEAGVRALQRST